MLKRKIYSELLLWKKQRREDKLKKCLLIKGARQVGKSYILNAFGRNEYKSLIYLDFFKHPDLMRIFEGDLSPDEIYKKMSGSIPDINFITGETLIFLDEIQCCGNARTAVKFLAEDFRYDVVLSGSLLGLSYGEDENSQIPASVPVGYERSITMYSLDFEEFLWAYGYNEDSINQVKTYFDSGIQIPDVIHNKFEQLFREFMVVGGMPEAVADFAVNKDFSRVYNLQKDILSQYQDDISKHARGKEKEYVRMCYDAVPKQLAKEQKKFQYSTVEKGQTRRKYGGSVKWLKDSCMVNVCYNIHEPYIPLMANANDDQFKLYINDTGLLTSMYGFETKKALLENTLLGNAKGGIYENIAAECLIKRGYSLYYYKKDDNGEIEFLIEKNGEVIPVEVKATNSSTVSLNRFIDKYKPSVAYKLVSTKGGRVDTKLTIPHYMLMFV